MEAARPTNKAVQPESCVHAKEEVYRHDPWERLRIWIICSEEVDACQKRAQAVPTLQPLPCNPKKATS